MVMISVRELHVSPVSPLDPMDGLRQAGVLATGDIVISDGSSPPRLILEEIALIPFLRGMLYGLFLCTLRKESTFRVPIDEQDAVVVFGVKGRTITRFVITTVVGNVLEEGSLSAGVGEQDIFDLLEVVLKACRGAVGGEWSYVFSDPILKDMYRRQLNEDRRQPA
jgi:hypothetical protein